MDKGLDCFISKEEIVMEKNEFTDLLTSNGWKNTKSYDCEVWYKGRILISIKYDEDNKAFIEIPKGEKGYVSEIKDISFTPYRILIRWNGDDEWFMRY